MLAAHRNGGRTNFISFARAWDRFARSKRARRATEREIEVLVAHLEASLRRGATSTSAAPSPTTRRSRASARPARRRASASGWLRRRDDARDEELV